MSDTNIVPIVGNDPAGGRQQRWRRNQPKRTRKPKAQPLLSASSETASSAADTAAPVAENASSSKDVVTVSDRLPEYQSSAVQKSEIRLEGRRVRGGISGATFAARATSPLAVLVSLSLAGVAAYFSIAGLVVVYPYEAPAIIIAGVAFEVAKFVGVAFLGAHARQISIPMWAILFVLLAVVEGINATGVYSRLIEDHVGPAGARAATYQQADAGAGAGIEVAQSRVANLDRQIQQIDDAIATATKRGRTNGAMRLAEQQRRNRAQLSAERDKAQQELSGLRAGRTGLAAKHQEAEAATLPVKYAADMLGELGVLSAAQVADPERVVRWLSLAFLLALDPLALALTFAVSSMRRA